MDHHTVAGADVERHPDHVEQRDDEPEQQPENTGCEQQCGIAPVAAGGGLFQLADRGVVEFVHRGLNGAHEITSASEMSGSR
ncbi:hypothetical protein SDC9_105344 [bioreactor metagenome]|uniref:Uncharacterized protein n=1 Tax=bioreactor metagenome TaxID=1076179 RepID=A0A645B5U7_9ZZZZ